MDETMGDGAKDSGPFQQRNAPAVKTEGVIAESMDETTNGDLVATTQNTEHDTPDRHSNTPRRQNQGGPRSARATERRSAKRKAKLMAKRAIENGRAPE